MTDIDTHNDDAIELEEKPTHITHIRNMYERLCVNMSICTYSVSDTSISFYLEDNIKNADTQHFLYQKQKNVHKTN